MANKKASGANVGSFFEKIGDGTIWFFSNFDVVWRYIMKFRKLILAVPVVIGATWMAVYSNGKLPEYVGINMQETGEFAQMVSREVAVMGPLAVTAFCLLLMFCSRRTLYPWLISLFSLVLPLFLILSNMYPA